MDSLNGCDEFEENHRKRYVDAEAITNALGLSNRRWHDVNNTVAFCPGDVYDLIIRDTKQHDPGEVRKVIQKIANQYTSKVPSSFETQISESDDQLFLKISKMKTSIYELLSGSPMKMKENKKGRFAAICEAPFCAAKLQVRIAANNQSIQTSGWIVCHSEACLSHHYDFYDFGRLKKLRPLLLVLLHQLVTEIYPHFGSIMRHTLRVSKKQKLDCKFSFLQYYSMEHLSPVYGKQYCESAFEWFSDLYNTVAKFIRQNTEWEVQPFNVPSAKCTWTIFNKVFCRWLLYQSTPKIERNKKRKQETLRLTVKDARSSETICGPKKGTLEETSRNEEERSNLTEIEGSKTPENNEILANKNCPLPFSPRRILETVDNPTDRLERFLNVDMDRCFEEDPDMQYARKLHSGEYNIPANDGRDLKKTPLEGYHPFCAKHGITLGFMGRLRPRVWLGDETIAAMLELIDQFHKGKLGPSHKSPVVINSQVYTTRYDSKCRWRVSRRKRKHIEADDGAELHGNVNMVAIVIHEPAHWKLIVAKLREDREGGTVQCWDSLNRPYDTPSQIRERFAEHVTAITQWFVDHSKETEREYWID